MNLEILSLKDAVKFVPLEKSYAMRIEGPFDQNIFFNPLKESENWVKSNNYCFDDLWPENWKEYSGYDPSGEEFQKYLKDQQKEYPKMTAESLLGYFESRGHPYGRYTLFDEEIAKKILDDFEMVKEEVNCVMVHCSRGKNRSPAVGMAMNEIYGWGIEDLKEKFPEYRRYVYQTMIDVSKKRLLRHPELWFYHKEQ